ncbi:restriction endonuclease subunit S [Lactobacillus buchneri]|uniref:restriction endonuclease subunit S n=1 Tax=Lentilactobacillus buchneri TaxID=1581 RepID=UPI0012914979|nr:restriction endonuclease subunit S [Lentilactobacillus buchneri]MQM83279.1 restriction endonuclease subunit S [Lentilactobacillus buchneri]
MSANQTKYPQLRFKGFTDPWEERKLADVVSISAGGDVDKTKLIEDGGYPVLANALTNSGIVGYYDSYKVEAPAVTVTGRGDVGHAVARHVNFTPVVRLLSLKSEVLDADFLANMLNQTNILVESTGVPQLTAPQLGSYKILYPNLNEQTKIGKLLNAFDNLIALHQRKLAKLKELKQGYLQKLFPENGSKFPQLRFAGFADAWEQRKTKELCDISTGKGNTQDKVEDGKYPFYVRSATIERSNEYLYDQEAVLTVGDGVGTGKVFHYVNGKYNLHQRVYRMFNFNHGVSAKYFYHYFSKNFYRRVMSMTAKTSVDSVRMEMIADMKIKFPSPAEQETIVSVLDGVDDTITLHQRKLEKLQELKKGYLQKMFC